MNIEKYKLKAEIELTRFEFISEGPKGTIRKLIEFQTTQIQNYSILRLAIKVAVQEK